MTFLETVRAERDRVAGMRAALDGRIAALDRVIASYEGMATEPVTAHGDHDHPQMFDARVATKDPVRGGAETPAHSSAAGSAGEEIPAQTESGSPSGAAASAHAPTQVASPAHPAAVESAAGTISDPGLPGVSPAPSAPARETRPASRAKPAAVEGVAGTHAKPTNKAFGNGLAQPHAEPAKPKPVGSSLPTARDPLLAREIGRPVSGKALPADQHPGSPGQQLADRILADLPQLMKDHPRGPIRADLADRYSVPPARVNDAVIALFGRRKIRLERFDGTEQHIVPPDFEVRPVVSAQPRSADPAQKPPPPPQADNREKVLAAMRGMANSAGLVEASMPAIARIAAVPTGSMGFIIPALIERGVIAIVDKPPLGTSKPTTYRVSPTPTGA